MPADTIETDLARWPIVVHRTIGIPSDDAVDAFIKRADAIMLRRQLHAVVFDSSQAGRVSPYMRKRSSEWLEQHSAILNKYCVGTALVFRSAALRFVMSTVMLVVSHPVPHHVCGTLDEALIWSTRQLDARRQGASG